MDLIYFILIYLTIPKKLSLAESYNLELEKYLEKLSNNLQKQIDKNRDVRQAQENTIIGSFRGSNVTPDPDINIFTFFNKTFFAIDNEIFVGTLNGILTMNNYGFFQREPSIFHRSIEYQQTGYIALSTKNEIYVYILTKNQTSPELIQTITNPYSSDSIFLINSDNLYLISSSNRGENLGTITCYKWLGSYFDETETIHVTGVVSLSSFPHEHSEIVLAAQSLSGNQKIQSSVYMFKEDKLRKIQQLNTKNPTHMNIFFQNNIPFVLLYEEMQNQKFYKWNGFEMVLVNRFQWEHKVDKSIVVYSNAIPLIVQPQLDKVLVFQPHNEDIQLSKTKGYHSNYSVILDINKGENENGNITFIVGLNEDNIINIHGMSFKAHAEMEIKQEGKLRNCFNNLEQKVYDLRKKLNQMINDSVDVTAVDTNIFNTRKRRTNSASNFEENSRDTLNNIKNRLKNINIYILNQGNFSNDIVINRKVILKSDISSKNIRANKIIFNNVNNKTWTPNMWLQNNKEQTINGQVNANKISTEKLIAEKKSFKKNLQKNGNQNISGNFKIKHLVARKIFSEQINNIKVDNIYALNNSIPVTGIKEFKNILVKKANITKINGKNTEDAISSLHNSSSTANTQFALNVTITNIETETINNIKWHQFEESLFKNGEDDTIEGNLSVPELVADNLQVKLLNGINPEHLMTKSTDQIINSTIEFNNIKTPNIKCTTVNDINLNQAVLIGQNNTNIKGHVKIEGITVLNNLELKGNVDKSLFLKESSHVFGTNESDLIQKYLGKIIINGSLYVKDFLVLQNTTTVLRGNDYNVDILKNYWNKNGDQVIPVHFEAMNGISTNHLNTKTLNKVPVETFVLITKKSKIQSPLFFKNVTVFGNVSLNENVSDTFGLKKLADEGVKNDRNTYTIKGKKIFKNKLQVKDLVLSGQYNNTQLLNKSRQELIQTLLIKGDLISNIHTTNINNINVTNYVNKLVSLRKLQNLTNMEFTNVIVENLYVNTINGKNVTEYIEKLQNIFKRKRAGKININGNVTLHRIKSVNTINGYEISELFNKNVSSNATEKRIARDVKFFGKVKTTNLIAQNVNKIYFPQLTKRLLHKKSDQTITGVYTLKYLKTGHLYSKKINNKNLENLIDISSNLSQQILAPYGISFKNILLKSSVVANQMVPCDISKAINKIKYPDNQKWTDIEIIGNVTLLDQNSDLIYLMKKSVKVEEQNIIEAPVTINGQVSAEQVIAKENVNNINLTELIQDAVLNDLDEEQVITGHKIFFKKIEADHVIVIENADIPIVNNINIPKLYNKIIPMDQVHNITIMGKKTFYRGLQTDKFLANKIAGIKPENIVSLDSLKQIPKVLFDKIEVIKDFNVEHVNSYDLNFVLNNRILTNTSENQITNGVYYFNDLEIRDNIATTAINNVQIKDVVFDIEEQQILAPKMFFHNITVYGNITIENLNGINITKKYDNAIKHGKDGIINGSMNISKPVNIKGNLSVEMIKGFPIEKIKQTMAQTVNKTEEKTIININEKLKDVIKETWPVVNHMPIEFMYIEKFKNIQVNIQDALDARVTSINDYLLIQIIGEEFHEKCGLPKGCKCSVQHNVKITPPMSVSHELNKQQRIYNYNDNGLIIYLSTNSTSTDTKCRINQTEEDKEISLLVWKTPSTSESLNAYPTIFTGYISGVEFFSINGITYAVIAQYYDPIADTHDLDCIVIRFSENKNAAMEIQKISTKGAWTLNLLHTAQGVTLVIGNLAKEPYTEIHRFDLKTEMFHLLRTVSYGCSKAAGVVLGNGSLIILANKEEPLQVLKYNPVYDNYYFYQMFPLGEPVLGISVFYIGDFGISEAYLCVITEDNYRIYSFQYIDGWKLESKGMIQGVRNLIPFNINNQLYLFAPSDSVSSLLSVVKNGASNN